MYGCTLRNAIYIFLHIFYLSKYPKHARVYDLYLLHQCFFLKTLHCMDTTTNILLSIKIPNSAKKYGLDSGSSNVWTETVFQYGL